VIICSRCGKENQDQFKYCLGCGSKLQVAVPAAADPFRAPPAAQEPALWAWRRLSRPAAHRRGRSRVRCGLSGHAFPGTRSRRGSGGSAGCFPWLGSPCSPCQWGDRRPADRADFSGPVSSPSRAPTLRWARGVPAATCDLAAGRCCRASRLATARPPGAPGRFQRWPSPAAPAAGAAPRVSVAAVQALPDRLGSQAQASHRQLPWRGRRVSAGDGRSGPAAASGPTCVHVVATRVCRLRILRSLRSSHEARAGAVVEARSSKPQRWPGAVKATVRASSRSSARRHRGGSHPLHRVKIWSDEPGPSLRRRPYLSPRHAEFVLTEAGLEVRDLRSLNGVFVKLTQEEPLESGDTLRIGQELLRFDAISPPRLSKMERDHRHAQPRVLGPLVRHRGRDVDGPAFPLFDETVVLAASARHPLSRGRLRLRHARADHSA